MVYSTGNLRGLTALLIGGELELEGQRIGIADRDAFRQVDVRERRLDRGGRSLCELNGLDRQAPDIADHLEPDGAVGVARDLDVPRGDLRDSRRKGLARHAVEIRDRGI